MRYAVLRGGRGLPPLEVQRDGLAAVPTDVAFEEAEATRKGQRALLRQLARLRTGDELLLWNLDVLQVSTAELLPLLLRFFEAGVTLRLTHGSGIETLTPADGASRALSLLAEHEARRPSRKPPARRPPRTEAPLSPSQLAHARELWRQGKSLRAIGLLFRLSPEDIGRALDGCVGNYEILTSDST